MAGETPALRNPSPAGLGGGGPPPLRVLTILKRYLESCRAGWIPRLGKSPLNARSRSDFLDTQLAGLVSVSPANLHVRLAQPPVRHSPPRPPPNLWAAVPPKKTPKQTPPVSTR